MEIKVRIDLRGEVETEHIARFVQVANRFESSLHLLVEGKHRVDAKSIMGMMNFLAEDGQEVVVQAEGSDEEEAARTLAGYLEGKK